ncbi:hypothetical protein [Williamsia muralis]|uniref:Uncharacterized protein n=1 Tax=Williamsia marianensis TaxID=85044 RepID=A0A2G3PR52_WILMA|nr:hypothetical protein [Williamsia marianensis]PHV68338.1 hypothetical protein CSW57_03645 [Williamsia marianensis]
MVNRVLVSAAVAGGAFISVVVLLTRLGGGHSVFGSDPWRVLYQGDVACVALCAVVAVVVSVLMGHSVAFFVGGAGLVALGVVAAVGTSADWASYVSAVAAGLLIAATGSLTVQEDSGKLLQSWLFAGALVGAWLARPLEQYRSSATYSGAYTSTGTPSDWPLVVGVVVALVLFAAARFTRPPHSRLPDENGRSATQRSPLGPTLTLGIGVPVVALLSWWWFIATLASGDGIEGGTWAYGIVLLPVVIVGVWWLPHRNGLVLVAMLATLTTAAGLPKWQGSWPMLLVFVLLIAGGLVSGRQWAHPMVAMGVLFACTLLTAVDESSWNAAGIVAAFIVPVAGAHVVAACLPTTAPISTIAVAGPATLFPVVGITVAYSFSNSTSSSGFDGYQSTTTEVILAAVTVAACGIALALLTRRRPPSDLDENGRLA